MAFLPLEFGRPREIVGFGEAESDVVRGENEDGAAWEVVLAGGDDIRGGLRNDDGRFVFLNFSGRVRA